MSASVVPHRRRRRPQRINEARNYASAASTPKAAGGAVAKQAAGGKAPLEQSEHAEGGGRAGAKRAAGARPPFLDVVVPVFNEAATVGELFARLQTACPGAHIVFVDNGSTDGTLAVLERLSGASVVRHSSNLGYGRSLLDGIGASSGDYIVMIDADLEYYPEDIPAIVAALKEAPAVYGSRFRGRSSGEAGMPLLRRLGNRVVTTLFNVLFDQRLSDLYTGLRGVRRDALTDAGLTRPGFELVLELAARVSGPGARIAEVPIRYAVRTRGRSKMRHVPEFLKFAKCLLELKVEEVVGRRG